MALSGLRARRSRTRAETSTPAGQTTRQDLQLRQAATTGSASSARGVREKRVPPARAHRLGRPDVVDRADGVALPARGARLNEAGNVDRFRERDVGELHAGIEKAAGIESVLDPDEEVVHLGAVQVAQELRPHAPIAVLSADRAAELRDHDPVDLP